MSNAALALLKGGSATPPTEPEKEATAVVPETADTEDDELDIDLDAMKTHKDIDTLMDTLESEYDIERPDDWKKLTKDAKKEFIASQCEDEDEAEAETPAEAAAEEPAAEAPKEEAKAEAAETPAEDDTGADDAKELGASISKKAEKPAKETKAKATKKADAKAVDDETASFESTVKDRKSVV